MKMKTSILTICTAALVASVGCAGRVAHNLPPAQRLMEPGPGVGGHCIAVDPWFIIASAPEESRLIRIARTVNDEKPDRILAGPTPRRRAPYRCLAGGLKGPEERDVDRCRGRG